MAVGCRATVPGTVAATLRAARATLAQLDSVVRSESPGLDAEVLLRTVLGWTREELLARTEAPVAPQQRRQLDGLLARRAAGEPVAYLTGFKEFMGLALAVSPAVLIPRPDTECLVERALAVLPDDGRRRVVADVGTGSGAIGIGLAVQRPMLHAYALDSDRRACDVAIANACSHEVTERVTVRCGDLLAPLPESADVIVANLPYIPSDVLPTLSVPVRDYEPRAALDGGDDGLAVYRRLLGQLAARPGSLRRPGHVLCECDPSQVEALSNLAREALPDAVIEVVHELAGRAQGIHARVRA
ncbi:MAG: protein-(glutamine-N5) methyltransferase, release factor-specific [Dehalococcoidia bacterium]|nr:protein-(glutamine-N5) methyltransferase, release factor-specific [Dehalococcoidia bacterium]